MRGVGLLREAYSQELAPIWMWVFLKNPFLISSLRRPSFAQVKLKHYC